MMREGATCTGEHGPWRPSGLSVEARFPLLTRCLFPSPQDLPRPYDDQQQL